jgi:diguanylate cyclase (GGDEF)-like protein/PAS domain S-box-containing protein
MPDKPTYQELEGKIKAMEGEAAKTSTADAIQKEYEIQYHALFDSAHDAIVLMNRNLVIDCNKRLLELLHCTREQVIGHHTPEFWPERQPDGRLSIESSIDHIKAALNNEHKPYEFRHKCLDGMLVDTDVTLNIFEIKGKKYLQAIIRDITEKKATEEALRQSEERYRTVLEDILEGCYETDMEGNFTFFNNSFCKILCVSSQEITGINYKKFTDEEHAEKLNHIFNSVFTSGIPNRCFDCVVIMNDYSKKNAEISVSLIRDSEGKAIGFRGILRDITERKKNEEMIAYMAFHDSLTGLPNRRLFDDRLYIALEFVKRNKKKLAVMLMDLDKFKEINDTLGHQMGDKLLREVSTRINGQVRKSDTLARMGGDEFMVLLLPEVNKPEDVLVVANRIMRSFREPFLCDGMELFTAASIGIAIYPDHGENVDTLISRADIAMYQAKKAGGNSFKIFD